MRFSCLQETHSFVVLGWGFPVIGPECAADKPVAGRVRFLTEIDVVAQWSALVAVIEGICFRGEGRGQLSGSGDCQNCCVCGGWGTFGDCFFVGVGPRQAVRGPFKVAQVFKVANLMRDALLESRLIYMDETRLQVLKEPRRDSTTES